MGSGSSAPKLEKPKNSLVLYMLEPSAPSRCVMMTAQLAGVDLQYERVNVLEGEQMKKEYLQMNPDHTIPTLKDGDFVLWESRAISKYLINRYATGHSLYPLDPLQRATIDKLLDWDLGVLFKAITVYCYPTAFTGATPPEGTEDEMRKALENMNGKLEGRRYLAGDTLTLADLSAVFNLSWLEIHPNFDMSPYPNVLTWRETIREMPEFKKINEGFAGFIKSKVGGD